MTIIDTITKYLDWLATAGAEFGAQYVAWKNGEKFHPKEFEKDARKHIDWLRNSPPWGPNSWPAGLTAELTDAAVVRAFMESANTVAKLSGDMDDKAPEPVDNSFFEELKRDYNAIERKLPRDNMQKSYRPRTITTTGTDTWPSTEFK